MNYNFRSHIFSLFLHQTSAYKRVTELHEHLAKDSLVVNSEGKALRLLSQLVAVDVILIHGLFHVVADQHAERAGAVALLVSLQLVLGDEGKLLVAVATHQQLAEREQVNTAGVLTQR